VLIREKNPRDENYKPLAENWERMRDLRLEDGSKPEVVELPMPAPLYFDGRGCPRATPIFTSATPPSSSPRSTTRTTASRSAFWANCSATAPSSAFTPWIWSGLRLVALPHAAAAGVIKLLKEINVKILTQ
jgi:hypothetical protein